MIIGYARVSTTDQNLDAQLDALKEAGAERVLSETISGATAKRPELQRMLDQLRDGDVVMVTKYDRLAQSSRHRGSHQRARGGVPVFGRKYRHDHASRRTDLPRLCIHRPFFERCRIAERTREG